VCPGSVTKLLQKSFESVARRMDCCITSKEQGHTVRMTKAPMATHPPSVFCSFVSGLSSCFDCVASIVSCVALKQVWIPGTSWKEVE